MTAAVADRDWRSGRACTTAEAELFFPDRYDPADQAKALCRACPVREDCLRFSLETPAAAWGIWGGFGGKARRIVGREYRAGRPLADIIAADDDRFYASHEDEAAARRAAAYQRKLARERQKRREQREAQAVAA